jgi:hypothetical protein
MDELWWVQYGGSILIILAWLCQIFFTYFRKDKKIRPIFIIIYCLGVGLIVFDNYMMGITDVAVLNLIIFILPLIVLYKLIHHPHHHPKD